MEIHRPESTDSRLARTGSKIKPRKFGVSSVISLVIIGGEKALPERLKTWQEYVGQRVRLVNGYGSTEATVVTTINELSAANLASRMLPIESFLISQVVKNY